MRNRLLPLFAACTLWPGAAPHARAAHGHAESPSTNTFNVAVPVHAYDLILARPESNSITVSVLASFDMEGFVVFGTRLDSGADRTPVTSFKAGAPRELTLAPLQPDTGYRYQFCWRRPGAAQFTNSAEYSFHTARPPGGSFTFTLTADAHLDERTSAEVYQQTLANIRAEQPDFHIDLGNLFMTDKHAARDEAARQYVAQRFYLGQAGCTVPMFLALGTHDGESGRYDDGTADCLAVWSNLVRKRYFPNPIPDSFYSGNAAPKIRCGLPQNYYAWTWGDALFVVLDPFSNSTPSRGDRTGWEWSLGSAQYQWLKGTLEQSQARFKFVFIHNLLSGDQASRGGVEIAGFNEWGGRNSDGNAGFAEHRAGWEAPVHELLVRNRVTAVFKAHDNFYARQKLDGIVYLMVPQPSFAGNDRIRDLQAYGYKQGVFLGNSGHVRVEVEPEKVSIDYVKTGNVVADECVIAARK
ncbi:MAG: metallophosphoesterase [Verrucomicrobiota bacterium]